jgi:hypothetical protein
VAHSFRIQVTGDTHTVRVVGDKADSIPLALRLATDEAARILESSIKDHAPEPRSNEEVQGSGISTRVERRYRFAGRAKGGKLATNQSFTVSAVVDSQSVAAYTEWGTGIYARPERGGPHTPWTIIAKRKKVTIEGMKPNPFITEGIEAVHSEIDALYEAAVREAV